MPLVATGLSECAERAGMGSPELRGRHMEVLHLAVKPYVVTMAVEYRQIHVHTTDLLVAPRKHRQGTHSNPVSHATAGLVAMCAGDTRSAAVFFRKSLELNPNQPQLR